MKTVAHLSRIQLDHRQYDGCPLDVEIETTDDKYLLIAPSRKGQCMIVRDRQVVFEGESRPGMLRITAPGEKDRVSIMSPAHHVAVTIPGTEMREILERFEEGGGSQSSPWVPLTQPDERVKQAVNASFAATEFQDDLHRQLFVDGLAHSMLACLLTARTQMVKPRVSSQLRVLSESEFDRCTQYADAMMERKLDLPAWAGVVSMSTMEFTKRFRKFTQQSPYAWFLNRRINRAKKLLQDRRNSIVDVALLVGFCSQSHFTETFRQRVGCSPARWRAESAA